ncbi:MAG: nucleotidyltransferase family protein [Mucilaginibacter sp.]
MENMDPMNTYRKHLIGKDADVRQALQKLNDLGIDTILFVVGDDDTLIGALTDGDIRRGLLKGLGLENRVHEFSQNSPKVFKRGNYTVEEVMEFRENGLKLVPFVDDEMRIINIINFRYHKSYLPVDAIIMAGGRGERLKPLTNDLPKPLLKVGDKPIIEHNLDQLISYGIDNIWISLRYLGKKIENNFKDGSEKNARIKYIWEDFPLGTVGAASKVEDIEQDYVLIMNSDILTNLNYEDFFVDFISKDAALSVVTIPYHVTVPYAVLETDNDCLVAFKEKPTYTYFSNGGIYLMKKHCLSLIPEDTFYNTTDLIEQLIANGEKVTTYPMVGYWLDIGKHEDFEKAQADIKHIDF